VSCTRDLSLRTTASRSAYCRGSVPGPLLFVLYTADLAPLIQKHSLHCLLYADNTKVYGWCQPHDVVPLQDSMSQCIDDDVSQWTSSNRMQLNAEYAWCAPAHHLHHIPSTDVKVGPVQLARVLGVYIDGDMTMMTHINHVLSSCFNSVHCDRYNPSSGLCHHIRIWINDRQNLRWSITSMSVLRCLWHGAQLRLKCRKTAHALDTLVTSLVHSRLDYCNDVFACLPACDLQRLQSVLNAAV